MVEQNEFEEIYGPSYPFAKYQIGDTITFPDSSKPGGVNSGQVLHVTPPSKNVSCSYLVTPATDSFPIEVFANEVID